MNKTIAVHAHFIEYVSNNDTYDISYQISDGVVGKIKDFFIKRAVQKEILTGAQSNKKIITTSDKHIDIARLNVDINIEISNLNMQGYEVISITPITSGEYKYDFKAPMINARDRASYGWGYGFSYTCGVIITAKKS